MNIYWQFVTDGNSGSVMLCNDEQPSNILAQVVTAGSDGSVTLCKEEQYKNISTQFVTDGNSGRVALCKDLQLMNILEQLVTDGSDGSLTSISATHPANKNDTLLTESKFKCDKSANFNARHTWNAFRIVVTNDVSQIGVISINLPQH